ncbi:MAG: TIGR03089 family protein [Propionibacteriaceae bacterium]|nr:TIGR03089 family protein [Propionibacteriaceae bacterium]
MFIDRLHRRPAASPLITHYDAAAGTRVELSGHTFTNWVDKTANLLEDLGVDPGETIHLELLTSAPGHWVTAVWVAGCWQRGCVLAAAPGGEAVAVVGPDSPTRGPITVMCSLHPLGLALPAPVPDCVDFAEVLVQPDARVVEPVAPEDIAWLPDITHAQVAQTASSQSRRLFADPRPGWATVQQLLIAPMLGGGSTVVATGASQQRLDEIATQEHAMFTKL